MIMKLFLWLKAEFLLIFALASPPPTHYRYSYNLLRGWPQMSNRPSLPWTLDIISPYIRYIHTPWLRHSNFYHTRNNRIQNTKVAYSDLDFGWGQKNLGCSIKLITWRRGISYAVIYSVNWFFCFKLCSSNRDKFIILRSSLDSGFSFILNLLDSWSQDWIMYYVS
jgi:hypothetical protein